MKISSPGTCVRILLGVCAVLTGILAARADASTVRYRTDEELIAMSERVVHARVLALRTARPEPDGAIYTVTTLAVLEDFTGREGDTLEVWELGGAYGEEMMIVGGAVRYPISSEVFVMLERGRRGLRSAAMGFSKFDVLPVGGDDALLTRSVHDTVIVGGAAAPPQRTLAQFRELARQVRGVPSRRHQAAAAMVPELSGADQFTLLKFSNGLGARWAEADSGIPVTWYKNTSAAPPLTSGDGTSEIQTALSAWTNPSSASLVLNYGGTTNQADADGPWAGIGDGNGVITFEDPDNEIGGNTLAIGGGWATFSSSTVNGTTFNRFTRGYVIFQNAADLSASFKESLNFSRVMQHEIGHGVGLGHTQTDGSVSNAQSNIMYPSCCVSITPVPPALGADDLTGLNFIYPGTTSCSYSISPTSASYGSGSATGTVNVTATAGCSWTAAVSSGTFLSVSSGGSGTGNGTVAYSVAANTASSSRSGALAIAGQTFTVSQSGCTYGLNPASVTSDGAAANGTVSLTTQPGCGWAAASNSSFIAITSAASGAGSTSVAYTIAANATGSERTGTATIGGQTFTVVQTVAWFDALRARENARADFNGDGRSDLLWQEIENGYLAIWGLDGHTIRSIRALSQFVPNNDWRIVGTGDFNADGKPDIVWHHRTEGWLYLWYMDGVTAVGETFLSEPRVADTGWRVVAVGDINGDRKPDLIWRHAANGWLAAWLMDGRNVTSARELTPNRIADPDWEIAGLGDFNADGHNDLVWRHYGTGHVLVWYMNGLAQVTDVWVTPRVIADPNWRIAAVIDANGDTKPDLVWHHATSGLAIVWYMNGVTQTSDPSFAEIVSTNWKIVGPR